MFSSGRITLRNRKFLREYTAIATDQPEPIPSTIVPLDSTHGGGDDTLLPGSSTPPPKPVDLQRVSDIESSNSSSSEKEVVLARPVPRALKNLLPYNKPGLKESLTPTDLKIKTGSSICRSEMKSLAAILVCPIQFMEI